MAHRVIINDGTTQTEAPDNSVPIIDARYNAVFTYDPGNGNAPVPHNLVLDAGGLGASSNTTLRFTQLPRVDEYRVEIPLAWSHTGAQPVAVRLFVTDDPTDHQQIEIRNFNPYQDNFQLNLADHPRISRNVPYHMFLFAVDDGGNVIDSVVEAESPTTFTFIDHRLVLERAPEGDIGENDRVRVQWRSDSGILPISVGLFASRTPDGSTGFIGMFTKLSPGGANDHFDWDATMSLGVPKGEDLYVALRPLEAGGAPIEDATAIFAPATFNIIDSSKVSIRFSQPTTVETKHAGDAVAVAWNYEGIRPPNVRVYATTDPYNLVDNLNEVVPIRPTTEGGDTGGWLIPNGVPSGNYHFVAVAYDNSSIPITPQLKGISNAFIVAEKPAPYIITINLQNNRIPVGQALGVSWTKTNGYARGGVRWFYTTNPNRTSYDNASDLVVLGQSDSWMGNSRTPITTIPKGRFHFGVVGLDESRQPIANTAAMVEIEITAPMTYTMVFNSPQEGDEIVDVPEDGEIIPIWGFTDNKPEALTLRIIKVAGGMSPPGEFRIDSYEPRYRVPASEILNAGFRVGELLRFEIIPRVSGANVDSGAARSSQFRIMRNYNLSIGGVGDSYTTGDEVRIDIGCNPRPSAPDRFSLNVVDERYTPINHVNVETDATNNLYAVWRADNSSFTRARFVLDIVDTSNPGGGPLATTESDLFDIGNHIDYTLGFTNDPLQPTYTLGSGEIELKWDWQPEDPTDLSVYLMIYEEGNRNGNYQVIDLDAGEIRGRRKQWPIQEPRLGTDGNGYREGMQLIFEIGANARDFRNAAGQSYTPGETSIPFTLVSAPAPIVPMRVTNVRINRQSFTGRPIEVQRGQELIVDLTVQDTNGNVLGGISVNPIDTPRFTDILEGDRNFNELFTNDGGNVHFENWGAIKADAESGVYNLSFDLRDSVHTERTASPFAISIKITGNQPQPQKPSENAEFLLKIEGNQINSVQAARNINAVINATTPLSQSIDGMFEIQNTGGGKLNWWIKTTGGIMVKPSGGNIGRGVSRQVKAIIQNASSVSNRPSLIVFAKRGTENAYSEDHFEFMVTINYQVSR
jgi:hypothetical protein